MQYFFDEAFLLTSVYNFDCHMFHQHEIHEPYHENKQCGLRPGHTQSGMGSDKRHTLLDLKFRGIIRLKTKALISFEVTVKLICALVFEYAKHLFHNAARIIQGR